MSDDNMKETSGYRNSTNSTVDTRESREDPLIRHHEYQSPRESKIDVALRSNKENLNKTMNEETSGAKKLTLAQLALGAQSKDAELLSSSGHSTSPKLQSPQHVRPSSASFTAIDIPDVITNDQVNIEADSTGFRSRGGSDLSDLINQSSTDNDSHHASTLSVNESWMGSQASVYSMDNIFSNHDVTGEIMISCLYFKGYFKVKIFQARGLTAVDDSNACNPYVKVYLLPDQSRTGKRKTKIKHGTFNPEFNEELLFEIGTAELLRRTVWVCVWHYDRFGRNEFLGEVRISLRDYPGSEIASAWYTLMPSQPKDRKDNDQGEIVVALMYAPADKKRNARTGKLYVKIIEARNLAGKDTDGLSDPFCKSYLLPDPQKRSKKKTPVKKRNLNPRWNYKFHYEDKTLKDLQHHVLELTVWDHDLGSSNDFLGGVRIGLGTSDASWDDCSGEEVKLWQFLLCKPNTWAESTLPLRSDMSSRKC